MLLKREKLPSVALVGQWQQNRVTVFIWMGKKLALPFPVVKLMVAAVGSNGDGSGGSVWGDRTKAAIRREERREISSTKNSLWKVVLSPCQVKKLVLLRRNIRSQSFYEHNLFKSGVYKPSQVFMCTAFFKWNSFQDHSKPSLAVQQEKNHYIYFYKQSIGPTCIFLLKQKVIVL